MGADEPTQGSTSPTNAGSIGSPPGRGRHRPGACSSGLWNVRVRGEPAGARNHPAHDLHLCEPIRWELRPSHERERWGVRSVREAAPRRDPARVPSGDPGEYLGPAEGCARSGPGRSGSTRSRPGRPNADHLLIPYASPQLTHVPGRSGRRARARSCDDPVRVGIPWDRLHAELLFGDAGGHRDLGLPPVRPELELGKAAPDRGPRDRHHGRGVPPMGDRALPAGPAPIELGILVGTGRS